MKGLAIGVVARLLELAAKAGNMGFKLDDPKPLGWTSPHQSGREIARRRRQMQRDALKQKP